MSISRKISNTVKIAFSYCLYKALSDTLYTGTSIVNNYMITLYNYECADSDGVKNIIFIEFVNIRSQKNIITVKIAFSYCIYINHLVVLYTFVSRELVIQSLQYILFHRNNFQFQNVTFTLC